MTKGSHPRVQTARDDKLKEFNDFQGNKKRSGITNLNKSKCSLKVSLASKGSKTRCFYF